jgi:hypothetical protein
VQNWDKLFKEAMLDEKNKLIQCLYDLCSGKIKHPSELGNSDPSKLDKLELKAVLEEWRLQK